MAVASWGEGRVLSEEERSTLASFEAGEADLNQVVEGMGGEGEVPPTEEGRDDDGADEGAFSTANGE
jgi:hypothetical protein